VGYPVGPRTDHGVQPDTPKYQNAAEHKCTASRYDDDAAQVLKALSKNPVGSPRHQKKRWYGHQNKSKAELEGYGERRKKFPEEPVDPDFGTLKN
jgi:hypothetical protein